MSTLTPERAAAPAASVTLSPARVLDTPLPQLLVEAGVELVDSSITDAGFCGAIVQPKHGGTVLMMPTGRSETETDTVARSLIAKAFHVNLSELPPPFTTTEL